MTFVTGSAGLFCAPPRNPFAEEPCFIWQPKVSVTAGAGGMHPERSTPELDLSHRPIAAQMH